MTTDRTVLAAAPRVLAARRADMLTLEERVNLARAAAAVTLCTTTDLLWPRDFEDIADHHAHAWDRTVDRPLSPADAL